MSCAVVSPIDRLAPNMTWRRLRSDTNGMARARSFDDFGKRFSITGFASGAGKASADGRAFVHEARRRQNPTRP